LEGAVFYWTFWLYWVYLTFFMRKNHAYRLRLAVMVLLAIIFSTSHFIIGPFDIYASGLLLLLFSYIILSQDKRGTIFYLCICSLIISIAYVTIQLFEIFDPIWMILNREWMMGIVISYLSLLLKKSLKGRLLIVVSGLVQGEFLYAYILQTLHLPYQIGTLAFLDVCSIIVAIVTGWWFLENAGAILQQHFHFTEKAKQKTS
jgi:hypothetical protein